MQCFLNKFDKKYIFLFLLLFFSKLFKELFTKEKSCLYLFFISSIFFDINFTTLGSVKQ